MHVKERCRWLGKLVGARPLHFFLASLALFVASAVVLAVKRPDLVLSFDDGYTRPDAPSIAELNAQIQFFGNKGKPWYMALFAEPRLSNGSMMEDHEFQEFKHFYKNVKKNIVIREEGERDLTYMDFCGSMCNFNDVIFKTYDMAWFGFQWPVTNILGYKSNIGKYFFERKMGKGDELISSHLSALYFMVFINSTEMAADLSEFERLVGREVDNHNLNNSNHLILTLHGARGMESEIKRGTSIVGARVIAGLFLVAFVTLLSLVIMNRVHGRCTGRVLALFPAAFFLPIMAVVSAAATFSILGRHLNTLTFLSPMVTFALGLDGCFMLYNNWLQDSNRKKDNNSTILKTTFSRAVPSMCLILASALGLLLGGFYVVPEIANLSVFLGTAAGFTYLYQLFFFAPLMPWCSPISTHDKLAGAEETACSQQCNSQFWNITVIDSYTSILLNSKIVRISSVFVFCGLIVLPCMFGATKVNGNLDYRHLLPPDSPNNKGVHIMSDIVWPEFLHILFIIEQPPNFEDPQQYSRYKSFVQDVGQLPGALGESSNMVWINDFKRFSETPKNATSLDMSKFRPFITDEIYSAWRSGVKFLFTIEDKPVITKMLFMVGIEKIQTMADKAKLMAACREVTAKYSEFKAYPFDTEVGMADVITQIPSALYFIPLLIVMGLVVFHLFVSSNLLVSMVAILSTVSVYIGTILIPAVMGLTLNPFSVAFLLFSAAISYRFSSHICVVFQAQKGDLTSRVRESLTRALLPTVLSSIAGSALFLPVLFAPIVIFNYVALINFTLLLLGLLHSVVFVPVILAWLPDRLTNRHHQPCDDNC